MIEKKNLIFTGIITITILISILSTFTPALATEVRGYPSIYDLTPRIHDFIGSNNPSDFLGDIISIEAYSDWMHYSPLVQTVNETIEGLSGNYEKAMAIATYVKHCRNYSYPSLFGGSNTIIDIYESSTGLCGDASVLLAAMLRIAGIPSRAVLNARGSHAFTEVYINNSWIVIDATFGIGEPQIWTSYNPQYYPNRYYEYIDTLYDVSYPPIWDSVFSEVNLYKELSHSSDVISSTFGEGTVIYPVVARPVYATSEYPDAEVSLNAHDQFTLKTWLWHSGFYITCGSSGYIGMQEYYIYGQIADQGFSTSGLAIHAGYDKKLIPAFSYKMYYMFRENNVAYVDFNVTDGQTTIIRPEDFHKVPETSQNNFDVFMTLINELPTYESLNIPLTITAPSQIHEGETFTVTISLQDIPVDNAMVSFCGNTYYTNIQGSVQLTAPLIENVTAPEITEIIYASKEGYLSNQKPIVIKDRNVKPQLVISAPSFVFAGQTFHVIVTADNYTLDDVEIIFRNQTYYTNMSSVYITAPLIGYDINETIYAAKEGYLSDTRTILILSENITINPSQENMTENQIQNETRNSENITGENGNITIPTQNMTQNQTVPPGNQNITVPPENISWNGTRPPIENLTDNESEQDFPSNPGYTNDSRSNHPADSDKDYSIILSELTAYASIYFSYISHAWMSV